MSCQIATRISPPKRNIMGSHGQYWLIYSLLPPCLVCCGAAWEEMGFVPKVAFFPPFFSFFFYFLEVTVFVLSLTGPDSASLHTYCSVLMPTPEQTHRKSGRTARGFRRRWRNVFTACLGGRRRVLERQPGALTSKTHTGSFVAGWDFGMLCLEETCSPG